jgi:hypothetical protein
MVALRAAVVVFAAAV